MKNEFYGSIETNSKFDLKTYVDTLYTTSIAFD